MGRSFSKAAIHKGFGAGVGASITMMLVMAILRLTSNTTSIPELMEESLIRITGGKIESFFINNLGVGGKALLLVTIVEGTLLLGGLLGLGFTHLWLKLVGFRLPRYVSGLLYGLVVGLLLNAVFLPLVNQGFFGSNALQVTAPPDISRSLYGKELAPIGIGVPINMFLLTAIFGLALAYLLPWPRTVVPGGEAAMETPGTPMPRREFTRALGGGALALAGGGVLWGVIRRALEPPPDAGLVEVDLNAPQPTSAAGSNPTATTRAVAQTNPTSTTGSSNAGSNPTSTTSAQAQPTDVMANNSTKVADGGPTEVADGIHNVEMKPTPTMAEVPAAPQVPAGFENVKAVLVPATTPTESFYITTKNFIDPVVDGNSWSLAFKGMVDSPYSITLKDLQAMPSSERTETLACISNPVGGTLIGNAAWKGVSFADLLNKAKPKSGVVDVVVRGADGYADSFPLEVALKNDCFLAYQMNGQPLTTKHGFPARLLVPNIYGMKNCKWITEVELVNSDFKGYWESQGWDDVADYNTLSRIDSPSSGSIAAKPVYVGGIAFAGNRGVKKVEVTTDGGKTWNEAQIRVVPGKYAWVQWTFPWNPKAGTYNLQVRATDGTGALQTAQQADTYPNGADGYHSRQIRVS